jgi:hypothetical protein
MAAEVSGVWSDATVQLPRSIVWGYLPGAEKESNHWSQTILSKYFSMEEKKILVII